MWGKSLGSLLATRTRRSASSLLSSFSPHSFSNTATGVAGEDVLFTSPSPSKTADPSLLQPGVVVYDGVCHLCHQGVKWVIKADKFKKIKFCCLQSWAAEPYLRLCGLDREDVLHRFLFVEGPGLYHQASTGNGVMVSQFLANDSWNLPPPTSADLLLAWQKINNGVVPLMDSQWSCASDGFSDEVMLIAENNAALKVASYLPFPYSALSAFLVIPAPLRDPIYDYVAKRRYSWFGKEDECIVLQEKEMLERFIDAEELLNKYRSKSS